MEDWNDQSLLEIKYYLQYMIKIKDEYDLSLKEINGIQK